MIRVIGYRGRLARERDAARAAAGRSSPRLPKPPFPFVKRSSSCWSAILHFASQRAELDAGRARADSIALAPEYRVGLELENFAGTGDTSGTDSLEATLSLSGVLELGGKRDARRAFGASQLDTLQIEQQVRLLDVVAARRAELHRRCGGRGPRSRSPLRALPSQRARSKALQKRVTAARASARGARQSPDRAPPWAASRT